MLLLMGMFSMYTGLIYNDVFSLSIAVDSTTWHQFDTVHNSTDSEFDGIKIPFKTDYTKINIGSPYGFGIDPAWAHTDNKLNVLGPAQSANASRIEWQWMNVHMGGCANGWMYGCMDGNG